jgi:NTE family protein
MTVGDDPGTGTGPKPINLALQGGGSHGAFTWGVLDRFLQDKRIRIEAISGTSAGAMNAVVVADGLMRGGPEGARKRLRMFWDEVGRTAAFSPIQRSPYDMLMGNWGLSYSPMLFWLDAFTRSVSPYDFNPLNINPLRDIVENLIDFDCVRSCKDFKLFISATNVQTGRVRVFEGAAMTADMVMASACLPTMFQAVKIDGQHYWDGGYMGNPVLFPFIYESQSNDILIVQINPIEREDTPRSARDILDRINEISFNASLLRELRAVEFVSRMLDQDRLDSQSYRNLNIHIIGLHDHEAAFGPATKMNAEPAFLNHLFNKGRGAASNWLDRNYDAIGNRSTVNIRQMFEGDGYGEESES